MILPDEHWTIGDALLRAAECYGKRALIAVPANGARAYHPAGYEIDFAGAAAEVQRLMKLYASAGYGLGHRVALSLENRPEHFLHKLALNALGACCVPVNPDYRTSELAYLLRHARVDLAVVLGSRVPDMDAALAGVPDAPPVGGVEGFDGGLPPARRRPPRGRRHARHARQHPLHVGYHRPPQGVRALTPLRTRIGRLVCHARLPVDVP